jgi:S1-C subfamily serine protease
VALLVLVIAGQSYALVRLNGRLGRANTAAARARDNSDSRMRELAGKVTELEHRAGNAFDPAAIAAEATPSVFRVIAGDFSGTAFAFGHAPLTGGTYLATNYHVVEEFYKGGGRQVALERDNKRYTAKIDKVFQDKDLALLETSTVFRRLATASSPPVPGQPVLVIGAPFGLDDTVTSGVVSALRTKLDGPELQFDAPINPGNSGGPLVNARRQVVGIARAKATDAEGIGLAIPITVACPDLAYC